MLTRMLIWSLKNPYRKIFLEKYIIPSKKFHSFKIGHYVLFWRIKK